MTVIDNGSPISWFGILGVFLMLVVFNIASRGDAGQDGSKGGVEVSVPRVKFSGGFRFETLTSGLDTPWDLSWGPDAAIWVTERNGTISRINPFNGQITRAGRIQVIEVSESGLMGMAFHPDFSAQPYVYVVHSYASSGSIQNRLVRLRFNGVSLGHPKVLLDHIPGAPNHNGARLAVGPDRYLYVTTGDAEKPILSQQRSSLAGKVLRLTLDGQSAPGNPFNNAVYSIGHRNPQGIVFNPVTQALYITEHGPADNDEVNLVKKGGNYGWPDARGFCDGDVWGEKKYCRNNEVVEPMVVWTPTIAPSGLDYYNSELFPGWKGSLLFTTLRGSALYRLLLSSNGNRVVKQEVYFEGRFGRLRDVLVGPQGEIYLATTNRDGRARPSRGDDRILRIKPRSKN
jgi:glucose/arabinose dehydrogenase